MRNNCRPTLNRDTGSASSFFETAETGMKGWNEFVGIMLLKTLLDFQDTDRLSEKAIDNLREQTLKWEPPRTDPSRKTRNTALHPTDEEVKWPAFYTENMDVNMLTLALFRERFAGRGAAKQIAAFRQWLDWRLERGFHEWASPDYYSYTSNALLVVARHAPDKGIRDRATALLNYILAEYAVLQVNGYLGGPFHRGKGPEQRIDEYKSIQDVYCIFFGLGTAPKGMYEKGLWATDLAFSSSSRILALAQEVAGQKTREYWGVRH